MDRKSWTLFIGAWIVTVAGLAVMMLIVAITAPGIGYGMMGWRMGGGGWWMLLFALPVLLLYLMLIVAVVALFDERAPHQEM